MSVNIYSDYDSQLRHKRKNGTTSDKVLYNIIDGTTRLLKYQIEGYCIRMNWLLEKGETK